MVRKIRRTAVQANLPLWIARGARHTAVVSFDRPARKRGLKSQGRVNELTGLVGVFTDHSEVQVDSVNCDRGVRVAFASEGAEDWRLSAQLP